MQSRGGWNSSTWRRGANKRVRPKRKASLHASATEAGGGKTCTTVAALVDTNVLVYRFDPRFPGKQSIATELLRKGIAENTLRVPHQAIVEFIAAVSRPLLHGQALLPAHEARREAEELLSQFDILYPNDALVRTALRGAAAYQLSWFDAHLWAYAEHYGLNEILSEDFADGRLYGTVRIVNPFSHQ